MSLLNGLSALGAGMNAFAGAASRDEETRVRAPLLSSAAPAVATATDPAQAATAAPATDTPKGVPADYLPFYQEASKRTGIPIDVLIAQAKQESGFNPDAVGSAGEIGLHQIKPSTAANPGFGLRGIDPATLRDPRVNIAFAAEYLKTRAAAGADFNDPTVVDAALRRFNGGGDHNYVRNVRQHMDST